VATRALILLAGLLAGFFPGLASAAPSIEWREVDGKGEVRVCGLTAEALAATAPERLSDLLSVKVIAGEAEEGADLDALPELWGSLKREGECLLFRPRHRPAAGMVLLASFDGKDLGLAGAQGTGRLELREVVAGAEPKSRVLAVHPSGEEIPENLLRIYVTFSAPMSLKDIEKYVHLRDESGNEIPTAFVDIPGGLWDPGHRRLTLFLHPGRVKSGIAVGEEMGKVLQEGQVVTLEIDRKARDAEGAPLLEAARQSWRVGKAQGEALGASQFRLKVGKEERGQLEIGVLVALDHALALTSFEVRKQGQEIAGKFELEAGEKMLLFVPEKPWQRGETYTLAISAKLEDVAGNRLGRAFEVESGTEEEAAGLELAFNH